MFKIIRLFFILSLIGTSYPTFSEVFKCKEKGNITFSDKPCKKNAVDITREQHNTLPKRPTPSTSSRAEKSRQLVNALEASRIKRETRREIKTLEKRITQKKKLLEKELLKLDEKKGDADDEFHDDEFLAEDLKKKIDTEIATLKDNHSTEMKALTKKIEQLSEQLGNSN